MLICACLRCLLPMNTDIWHTAIVFCSFFFFNDAVIVLWIYKLYYGKRIHYRGCESVFCGVCFLWFIYMERRKSLAGQTMKNTPSMASVEVSYKPMKTLTLAGGIRYPFYDAWKQTVSVLGTSLLQRTETERIINNANMVYVTLSIIFLLDSKL